MATMATSVMVSSCPPAALQHTLDTSSGGEVDLPFNLKEITSTLAKTPFDGLSTLWSSFAQFQVSTEVADIIMASLSSGTQEQ